ncbi:hypothetical protein EDM56_00605 [Brevibacillus fluminis]|uniref:Uncharacterized protein n=1 Tax=Brevibacillus fluminis TaxID=511487 RepID=A0A3M8DYS1_9BACL|nr:toxin Cry1Ac domain D-VI-related protein [Brevibacillus fluminis]RNB92679.1 hypothetical protein EDM56_00605 [Brevibacillus fluminis]
MKNKKLALSVLSTAVIASMASSAFAATPGFYIGGEVKHFYSLDSFFSSKNNSKIEDEADKAGLDHVVYVDDEGNAATLDDLLESGEDALTDDLEAVFGDDITADYSSIDENGQDSGTVETPLDGPTVGDVTATPVDSKVTIAGTTKDAKTVDVTVIDKDGKDVATKTVDVKDNKFSADFADLAAGDYTYEVIASNDDADSKVKTGSFKIAAAAELKVDSVSAINSKQVELTFNKEVKSVKPADFTITKVSDGTRVFVSKAEVKADNKKVVTVTLFDALASGSEYNANTKNVVGADDKVITEDNDKFTYTKADVNAVSFTSTTVAPGTNLKDVIKVTDKLGRDVTSEVELEFASSDVGVVGSTGLVAGNADGKTVVVKVTVKGTTISTANTVLYVKNSTPTTFVGYHIAAKAAGNFPVGTTDAFKALKAEDVVHSVYMNETNKNLGLFYLDQFGKSVDVQEDGNADNVTFTNLTPEVVIVGNNGVITPISVGTGYVKAKIGNVEQTVAIEVKATPVFKTFDVEKSSVSTTEGSTIAESFKLVYKDQYNKDTAVPVSGVVTAVVADATIASATVSPDKSAVTITGLKAGSTSVKVTYTDNTDPSVKFEKVVNITVSAKGNFANYSVEVDKTNLNVVDDQATTVNESTATVKVYTLDDKGQKLSVVPAADVNLVLLDKDGKEINPATVVGTETGSFITFNDSTDVVSAKAAGTESIAVKIGSLTLQNVTFTVADSTAQAKSVVFNNSSIADAKLSDDLEDKILSLITVKDQYGKDFNANLQQSNLQISVTNIDGLTLDAGNVITALTKEGATADIVVTAVNVNNKNLLTTPTVIKLKVNGYDQIVQATKDAVAALFTDANKTALAVGVDQTKVDSAKTKVNALSDATLKASLLTDVAKAQDLLDQQIVNAEVSKYSNAVTIASTVAANTPITSSVVALQAGQTATTGVNANVTAVKAQDGSSAANYLGLVGNVVNLVAVNNTGTPVVEKATVTLTKGNATKTFVVDVTITNQ